MKKLLSILLALSIACGSVMMTACSENEKDDDDDKSVSDKERDEDEDDEDKEDDEDDEDDDKDKSDKDEDEDDKSDKDDDKSDEDEEDEKSDDEEDEESSKDEESSEDEEESSEDEEDEESSEDEDEGSASADGTYAAGEVVELSGVSFVVPEGFSCEVEGEYAEFVADDELSFETINIQITGADSVDLYTQEAVEELFTTLYEDSFSISDYEVSTLDGADTVYYVLSVDMDYLVMNMIQYCIFLDDASIIVTAGYTEDSSAATMDEFIDSFEVL